eukprot:1368839-Pleurochrysis_carterae.AAC.1
MPYRCPPPAARSKARGRLARCRRACRRSVRKLTLARQRPEARGPGIRCVRSNVPTACAGRRHSGVSRLSPPETGVSEEE